MNKIDAHHDCNTISNHLNRSDKTVEYNFYRKEEELEMNWLSNTSLSKKRLKLNRPNNQSVTLQNVSLPTTSKLSHASLFHPANLNSNKSLDIMQLNLGQDMIPNKRVPLNTGMNTDLKGEMKVESDDAIDDESVVSRSTRTMLLIDSSDSFSLVASDDVEVDDKSKSGSMEVNNDGVGMNAGDYLCDGNAAK